MKKLMTALAVCAAATLSLADGVPSLNVVGFKSDMSVPTNYFTMLAAPFQPIGARAVPIASLFADNTMFTAGYSISDGDSILVWNGAGYTQYYFSADLGGAWTLNGDDVTTDTIPVNGAFWFNRIGPALHGLTVVGEVVQTNIAAHAVANYFVMVGNPFAAALPITSITAPDLTQGYSISDGDSILVWTGAGYTQYYFSADLGGAWTLNGDDVTSDSIPAGGAFWFNRIGNATTLTMPVPYSL